MRSCGLEVGVTPGDQTISYFTSNADGSKRPDAIFKIVPTYLREIDMAERTVGVQGSAKIKHSVEPFASNDYSWQAYPTTFATSLYESNQTGWPAQNDSSLKVMRHTFFVGQTDGKVSLNQYQIDVFTFMNSGTWVDVVTKERKAVYCGNIAIVQSIENWNYCGRSTQAQGACESGAQGSALDFGITFASGNSWKSQNISGKQGLQYRCLEFLFAGRSCLYKLQDRCRDKEFDAARDKICRFPKMEIFWRGKNFPATRIQGGSSYTSSTQDSTAGASSVSSSNLQCSTISDRLTCKAQTSCTWQTACGCIPSKCLCGDDCCISGQCDNQYKLGCGAINDRTTCKSKTGCSWQSACGCIPNLCLCGDDCCIFGICENGVSATCPELPTATTCSEGNNCKYERNCGCIPSACTCGDNCCIYKNCTKPTSVTQSCLKFEVTFKEAGEGQTMNLRLPYNNHVDSYEFTSLLWVGGNGDLDGDGIVDALEGTDDADSDGVPNMLDEDSDGDGLRDSIEGVGDVDNDQIPNFLDEDSDGIRKPSNSKFDSLLTGDGISDYAEGTTSCYGDVIDFDHDGVPDYLDDDSDNDGISDRKESQNVPSDPDGDGMPNWRDLDSDNDKLLDSYEGVGDPDGDGIPNFVDFDSDGDTIPDAVEGSADADKDGIPNFLDLDSDSEKKLCANPALANFPVLR
eukprot:762521-Hanusia_phi.AAC.37